MKTKHLIILGILTLCPIGNLLANDRAAKEAEMLKQYDLDKDGKLSKEEQKAMMEAVNAEMLAKYDTNKDGKINGEELEAMKADRQKQPK